MVQSLPLRRGLEAPTERGRGMKENISDRKGCNIRSSAGPTKALAPDRIFKPEGVTSGAGN